MLPCVFRMPCIIIICGSFFDSVRKLHTSDCNQLSCFQMLTTGAVKLHASRAGYLMLCSACRVDVQVPSVEVCIAWCCALDNATSLFKRLEVGM